MVYILHGDEAFFIDSIVNWAESNILDEAESAFNLSVLYGREVNVSAIRDHAMQYPMMAERRVVIVKEAQALKEIASIESYIDHPSPQTVLIIAFKDKKIDGRSKWLKKVADHPEMALFTSEKIRDYKLGQWLDGYLAANNRKISPAANRMICDYLGNDLKKLINEIQKIELNIPVSQEIGLEEIEKFVGISKQFNVYELLAALGAKDTKRVYLILGSLMSNMQKNPIPMLLPAFYQYFQKVWIVREQRNASDQQLSKVLRVNPYFVKEYKQAAKNYSDSKLRSIFALISEMDARSKGVNNRKTNPEELLKELVTKTLYNESAVV